VIGALLRVPLIQLFSQAERKDLVAKKASVRNRVVQYGPHDLNYNLKSGV